MRKLCTCCLWPSRVLKLVYADNFGRWDVSVTTLDLEIWLMGGSLWTIFFVRICFKSFSCAVKKLPHFVYRTSGTYYKPGIFFNRPDQESNVNIQRDISSQQTRSRIGAPIRWCVAQRRNDNKPGEQTRRTNQMNKPDEQTRRTNQTN
jgi:hypothetical protein